MKTVATFLRLVDVAPESKSDVLRQVIDATRLSRGSGRSFTSPLEVFRSIPTAPFAYWAPTSLLRTFDTHTQYESGERTALQGASTCDDFRFVRAWYEVSTANTLDRDDNLHWVTFARGGRFSRFYADVPAVVRWNKSRTSFHGFIGRSGRWNPKPVSADHYFQPGLTWPLRGVVFSCSMLPAGSAYSVGGKVALAPREELPFLAAVFNSRVFNAAISLFAGKIGGVQYETGIVNQAPIPNSDNAQAQALASCSRRAWSLKRKLDTANETSHVFTLPALLKVTGNALTERGDTWSEHVRAIEAELSAIQAEIDARCFDLYGIDEADRIAITEGFAGGAANAANPTDVDVELETEEETEADNEADDQDDTENRMGATSLTAELASWAVGAAFGRFDVRVVTGVKAQPSEPDPFDPLPVCSPAMLMGEDGLPLMSAPAGYSLVLPDNGILTDDPGQARDLTAAVRAVFDEIFGVSADTWWNDAATLLNPKNHDLRAWLASRFFEHHLKRYSKSRRKAPILWQLSLPSGGYSIWLYAHRLTRDSFFQIQNDVVAPKLAHEERQLISLIQSAGANPPAKERKEIAEQEALVGELRSFLDEVKRVAPLWNPTLDDGVVLTMAPLWRLVPQHKAWQKELKSKWDELAAGKYDWAQLAMHLYPECVIPKCASDRSIAIAHGLENVFWVEGDDGKWKPRPDPMRSVDELVRKRTSLAVKAALKRLTEASAPSSPKARTRRSSS